MTSSSRHTLLAALLSITIPCAAQAQTAVPRRPFGTLREQADVQQRWLDQRMRMVLPALMRKHGVDAWVVPMREYNEDPVFSSLVSPTTFAARRRTIYVFFDKCASAGRVDPGDGSCVERIALGGTSQGGVFEARRAMAAVADDNSGRSAELWGDQQWSVLKSVLDERDPKVIAIDVSRTFAFTDGLSAGERDGMTAALGPALSARFRPAEALALELIATRLPDEVQFYSRLQNLVWELSQRMFSAEVVKPGVTRTSDLVWWWRQQVNDLGLGTWFQPSVEVQRKGVSDAELGDDPIIQRGDVLHSDLGITALGLNTDTQHMAYVLLPGETDAPAGLSAALLNSNKLQDIVMEELRPGRTGNEVLAASRKRMSELRITGTVYSHPIGKHGHGAGPLIGLWDYQDGVPGRGDAKVIASMWYSIELQATTPVAEWSGQSVRMAQEEDAVIGPDGVSRWAIKRQDRLFLIR